MALLFGLRFEDGGVYRDLAPRMGHPGLFSQKMFEKMVKKEKKRGSGNGHSRARDPCAQASRQEPGSVFSLFGPGLRPADSNLFGQAYYEPNSLHRPEDSFSIKINDRFPTNFSNVKELLSQEPVVKKLELSREKTSVKKRFEGETKGSEEGCGSSGFRDCEEALRIDRYEMDLQTLLNKI